MDVQNKREREKKTVDRMIRIYCHGVHGTKHGLCRECGELSDYAHMRSDCCPFMETKTFCSNCKVHCYKPEMKVKIKQVMRYSGWRMLFVDPVQAARHIVETIREKKRLEKENAS